jgi:hypothetical protein
VHLSKLTAALAGAGYPNSKVIQHSDASSALVDKSGSNVVIVVQKQPMLSPLTRWLLTICGMYYAVQYLPVFDILQFAVAFSLASTGAFVIGALLFGNMQR